jgi:SSS family transporter
MLILFVILYLCGTLAIGYWAGKKVHNVSDFALAGRHLPLFLAASATFATWFGTETVMGASSEFVENGVIGVIEDPFGAALCLLLVGLLVAKPLYKLNLITFSDYFRLRFGRKAEFIGALCMVPSYFGWIAAQFLALGILMHKLIPALPIEAGLWIGAVLVIGYTYVGGMWAISITDFVQTIFIIVGLLLVAVFMAQEISPAKVIAAQPEGFFDFLPKPGWMNWVHYLAAWMTIGLGSVPQQDVFQRVMAAKSEKTAIHSTFVAAGMYLTVAMLPLFIALSAKTLYPELLKGDVQDIIPNMVLQHSPLSIQALFFGALISAILSTASGAVLAPATVVGENLIKPRCLKLTDAALLRILRLSVVGVALISAAMASYRGNIYDLVSESSALSLVSLFVPLVGGLYWSKATEVGCVASMVVGMIGWLLALWMETEFPPMLIGFAASIMAMMVGSFWVLPKPVRALSS